LATKTWNASSNGNANTAGNWSPSGVPAVGDDCVFDGTAGYECDFDIPKVNAIRVTSAFAGVVVFGSNVVEIVAGLSVAKDRTIKCTTARIISFTGTPSFGAPANTNYIEYKCLDMFDTSTSRNNLQFKFGGSAQQTITGGIYPHLSFEVGFRAQYNAPPTGGIKHDVKMLSVNIGAGAVSQLTAIPNADDRKMNFIIETHQGFNGGASQFSTAVGSPQNFDGGWGTWTFQAKTAGFFFPVTGCETYNGYRFKFRNVIIDSTSNGNGGFVSLVHGCVLSLTNLTINSGAGIKGHDVYGAIIHLVNRPKIYGTWGFYATADGIYHYKGLYCLGVANGGTGITEVNEGNVLLGYKENILKSDDNFKYNTSNDTLSIGNGGIIFTPNTIGSPDAAQLWVNSADSNKLYFGSSAVGSGGGGGGGISGITVQDEGVALATLGTTFNFVDGVHPVATVPTAQPLSVQATGTGATKTITIDGSKVRTNAADTLPAYLDAKIQQGVNMSITLDTTNAASTGHAFTFAANNDKVKISALDTTENFLENKLIAGSNITLTKTLGNETLTIASTGGGAAGQPLFKHDQNPTSSNFNPHRLLVHGDTIEVGLATGSGKNVDVFTPAISSDGANRMITINATGAAATNTGREYIFFGQFGDRSTGDPVVYQFDNSGGSLTVPHFFIHHMSQVVLPATAPNFSFIVTHQLGIMQMTSVDSGFSPPNAVRVIDAGQFTLLNPSLDEENPIPHRLFLVVDIPYDAISRQPTALLSKNLS
jgi:hypothetical protein